MKLRRSMLFVPGTQPALIRDVPIYQPDTVIFDLEDAVAVSEKDAARYLVFEMILKLRPLYRKYGVEMAVRINGLESPYGREDLEAMVRARVDLIRLAKAEKADDIRAVDALITDIETRAGLESGSTRMMAAIESPLGILNAYAIATASPRMQALAIGAEDFVTAMKTQRSREGQELFAARGHIVMAARAAGIMAIDTVYSQVNDEDGFMAEARLIRQLGFDGKSLIHPRQVELVHQVYTPSEVEITKSLKIIRAAQQCLERGQGVFTVDGRMVDKPIIERAEHTLRLAVAAGALAGREIEVMLNAIGSERGPEHA